jgi:hypothetical protein
MASAILSLTPTPVLCSLFLNEQGLHPADGGNRVPLCANPQGIFPATGFLPQCFARWISQPYRPSRLQAALSDSPSPTLIESIRAG